MILNGGQCTIVWHVDDLKISHVDPKVVTEVTEDISRVCNGKVTVHRGKVHDYLGMDLDLETEPGVLVILMIKYLQQVIEEWPEQLTSTKSTPANDYLFTVRDEKERDVLGVMMWCKYFMEEQGYTVESNVLCQDNKSTILLAKNGRMAAGKASKHIKNRFHLATDKIAQGDLSVEYRPTKEMWADVNTKPLQGKLFHEMRAQLMGVPVDYDDDKERRRTHPKLLPEVEPEGVISRSDVEVLSKATGISGAPAPKESIAPASKTAAQRRSVLDEVKYGPGSRPLWADPGTPRFPNLTKSFLEAAREPLQRVTRPLGTIVST